MVIRHSHDKAEAYVDSAKLACLKAERAGGWIHKAIGTARRIDRVRECIGGTIRVGCSKLKVYYAAFVDHLVRDWVEERWLVDFLNIDKEELGIFASFAVNYSDGDAVSAGTIRFGGCPTHAAGGGVDGRTGWSLGKGISQRIDGKIGIRRPGLYDQLGPFGNRLAFDSIEDRWSVDFADIDDKRFGIRSPFSIISPNHHVVGPGAIGFSGLQLMP